MVQAVLSIRCRFVERLEPAIAEFIAFEQQDANAPRMNAIRQSLEKIEDQIESLSEFIETIQPEIYEALDDMMALRKRSLPDLLTRLQVDLSSLSDGIEMTLRKLERNNGRPPDDARTILAIRIRDILTSYGLKPTKTRGGPFDRCFGLALEADGVHMSEPLNVIRKVLPSKAKASQKV